MPNIIIVGNGMFGRIAFDMLAAEGIESTVVDSCEAHSGTKASGNITKPSWVSGLGDAGKVAYKDLDRLYGLKKIQPTLVGKSIDLFYVPREKIVGQPCLTAKVTSVEDGILILEDGRVLTGDRILLAAGVWTADLIEMPEMEKVAGVSFLFNKREHDPKFSMWAPYKQAISYQSSPDQVWFGDGTAIREKNFVEKNRVEDSLKRAANHGLTTEPVKTMVGYRPYVKHRKDGYFEQVYPHTWVSTGGGKNGIVLAAIQARRFLESL